MKNTIAIIAVILAASTASAGNISADAGGSFSGKASSFAATGGSSFGNGRSMSEAGQFAGSTSSLSGSASLADGMTVTGTTESFVQGFDKSRSWGNGISGAIRGGAAFGDVEYWGNANADW